MTTLGLRLGDPLGECNEDGPQLDVHTLQAVPGSPGSFLVGWSWTGCRRTLPFAMPQPLGAQPVWFKLYVNGTLYATGRQTRTVVNLGAGAGQVVASVVVVGPANGDEGYDPLIAITAPPGNRAQLVWPGAAASGVAVYRVYWDSGTGTVDYDTVKATVRHTGAATYTWLSEPLAAGTYKYAVKSVDAAGNESSATSVATVTLAPWPDQPTGLAYAYAPATDKVTLTWSGGATVNVYGNGGSGDIDYDTPVASGVTSPWTSGALTGAGTFRYGVRAVSGVLEEKNLTYIEFELDADEAEVNPPLVAFGLSATPAEGGTFALAAKVPTARPKVHGRTPPRPTHLKFYHDNGTGTMDWVTPIATVAVGVGPGLVYQAAYTTGAYGHGTTVLFGARAAASTVVEDNEKTVSAVADAEAPPAPASLAVTAAGDPWGG